MLDAPEIDRSPAYGKAAADKGGTAVLKYKAEGAPEVKFSWLRVSVRRRVPLKSSSLGSQCEYTIRLRALLKSSSRGSG